MAFQLLGTLPLSKPVLTYCQWDPLEQTYMKFKSKCEYFLSRKCSWKCCLQNGSHFVQAFSNTCLKLHTGLFFYPVSLTKPCETFSRFGSVPTYTEITKQCLFERELGHVSLSLSDIVCLYKKRFELSSSFCRCVPINRTSTTKMWRR